MARWSVEGAQSHGGELKAAVVVGLEFSCSRTETHAQTYSRRARR